MRQNEFLQAKQNYEWSLEFIKEINLKVEKIFNDLKIKLPELSQEDQIEIKKCQSEFFKEAKIQELYVFKIKEEVLTLLIDLYKSEEEK